ncbi:MAG: transcriptional regulator NrdR [Candidatus Micrarchaeia archaeon]
MRCPYCSSEKTRVIDSRDLGELEITRRRRECRKCKKRFTTYERVETIDLVVIKKDGRREKFDRGKLLAGVQKACEKRPISQERIEKLVEEIERELRNMDSLEVESKVIGELVMKKLKKLDKVAYIRFASVYREFADIESFEKELRALRKKMKRR